MRGLLLKPIRNGMGRDSTERPLHCLAATEISFVKSIHN